jgi:S-adenosyl methyltransferase
MLGADSGEVPAELPDWVPEGVDVTVPNAARMYDYMLGGYHNFAVDRDYVERLELTFPGTKPVVYANRAFLGRAIRWLTGAGIRQFLDIGSGIPTLGNVHEIAERAAPDVRVMYVDIDPVAVAHARAMLSGNPRVGVLQADLRHPTEIVNHPDVVSLLNFSKPMAVVLSAVLPFISDDDDPYRIVAQLRDAVVSGSYIVVSHATRIAELTEAQESARHIYQRTPTPGQFRSREQLMQLLAGLDLVEPGIVPVADWRPDPGEDAEPLPVSLAAVARKP